MRRIGSDRSTKIGFSLLRLVQLQSCAASKIQCIAVVTDIDETGFKRLHGFEPTGTGLQHRAQREVRRRIFGRCINGCAYQGFCIGNVSGVQITHPEQTQMLGAAASGCRRASRPIERFDIATGSKQDGRSGEQRIWIRWLGSENLVNAPQRQCIRIAPGQFANCVQRRLGR
ncbi:MAG: hypothetical protein ABI552_07645 [Casimicrobiaceae bacterium]